MRPFWILLGLGGRIGRMEFASGLVALAALFSSGVYASDYMRPWMYEPLAPHGIDATLANNMLWSLLGVLAAWSLIALGAKRLRDRVRSAWWIVVVVVPLAALMLLHNNIILMSTNLVVPPQAQWAVIIDSGLFGLWVLAECLFGPSHDGSADEPAPKAEAPKRGAATAGPARPEAQRSAAPRRPGLLASLEKRTDGR